MNRGVEGVTHFIKSPLNFLMESLGSFTCDVINEEGVTKVVSPVVGTVEGRVNAGSVGSVGESLEDFFTCPVMYYVWF